MKSLLTLKHLLGLDWVALNGRPPRFMFRTDDDVYVNIPTVDKIIIKDKQW